ncbi:hypothetical protein C7S13_4965 [Burkholderia cepacia]|nr:hypothetical protein [Burkholderia cepacia]
MPERGGDTSDEHRDDLLPAQCNQMYSYGIDGRSPRMMACSRRHDR